MKRQILIRPLAQEDLVEQFLFIAEGSKNSALRFFEMTQQTFEELLEMPNMGNPPPFKNVRLTGVRRKPWTR